VKLHTKKFENPQNDPNFLKIPKLQNAKTTFFSKFTRTKANTPSPPLQNFTQMFLKTHKMTRRKIENFETSK
jgi:hypothetical protein